MLLVFRRNLLASFSGFLISTNKNIIGIITIIGLRSAIIEILNPS